MWGTTPTVGEPSETPHSMGTFWPWTLVAVFILTPPTWQLSEAGRMATPSLFIRLTCFLSLQILRRLDCFILMTFTPRMACPLQCKEYTVQPSWALEISVAEKLWERLRGDLEAWWCKGEDSGIQGPSCHLPVGSSRQMTQTRQRTGHDPAPQIRTKGQPRHPPKAYKGSGGEGPASSEHSAAPEATSSPVQWGTALPVNWERDSFLCPSQGFL